MSVLNPYFSTGITQGRNSEQDLIEELIIESLKIYGVEVHYIPRTLVSKDEILGEDRLSRFQHAYPIEAYFENVDNFEGQGNFIQKFGLMVEQSATLVVARKTWQQVVGDKGTSILPNRPAEGDLIYFPLSGGLFEIKFVEHKDPFYQLGKLYQYKLQIELFQYASERIETGNAEIDVFESLKSLDTSFSKVQSVTVTGTGGSGYVTPPLVTFTSANGTGAKATAVLTGGVVTSVVINNGGVGYTAGTTVQFTGANTTPATGIVVLGDTSVDVVESYGDNDSFKQAASTVTWNVDNPFGE